MLNMCALLIRAPVCAVRFYSAGVSSGTVRQIFLDFFQQKHGHRVVPSSPVRPRGDPSLLFVNAGMNQFKPIFLGTADPRSEMAAYRRVANSQKCVRAGGKHNDLDDVGQDLHHHTFFEMLGSWSFGDYFKEEACSMAWALLTEHYGIPPDRLYVSYFGGDPASGLQADEETRHIWIELGVPAGRVLPFGLQQNFWEMGDTGPCGPCTEIHYDHTGGRHAPLLVNSDSADMVEIWNLVFIQYCREADHSLSSLPQHSVDTGMGLERLVTLLQGKRSNYDNDLFCPLLDALQKVSRRPYRGQIGEADDGRVDMAYRVVADHARTLAVCIADGVYPGMTGAPLVLRRILKRAVRFSSEVLQAPQGTLGSLVPAIVQVLGDTYPELHRERERIMEIINVNEDQFLSALQQGSRVIDRTLRKSNSTVFPAHVALSLHRHLGLPLDLLQVMLQERGVSLPPHTELQPPLAPSLQVSEVQQEPPPGLDPRSLASLQALGVPHTHDSLKYQCSLVGEDQRPACRATVQALYCQQQLRSEVICGQRCGVILDRTIFYAEQGGQSHDLGYLTCGGEQDVFHPVEGVAVSGGYVVHQVMAADNLRVGDQVQLFLDQEHRKACTLHHTSTHLLNFALRLLLGEQVEQRGAHVSAQHLRFDFTVKASLSVAQLQQLDGLLTSIIRSDEPVYVEQVPLERARAIAGLRTLDEVYPDPVRVVSVGVPVSELLVGRTGRQTSVELCCGTHVHSTGQLQDVVVVSERQTVKGVSRIVAVSAHLARQAREAGQALAQAVDSLSARTSVGPSSLLAAQRHAKHVGTLTDEVDNTPIPQWQRRELQGRLKTLQRSCNTVVRKLETREAERNARSVLEKNGDKHLLVDSVDTDSLSVLVKTVNKVCVGGSVMLLSHQQHSGKVLCACQVPKGSRLSANDWALAVCSRLGGSAGGSALVAKGTGSSDNIREALRWAEEFAARSQT